MDLDFAPPALGFPTPDLPTNALPLADSGNDTDESEIPRGVSPRILLEQVRNTVPFIFETTPSRRVPAERYLDRLRETSERLRNGSFAELAHADYFALCLSAHHATVSSFVPTDVDNQIRFKLWHPRLPTEVMTTMAEIVLESGQWDPRPVSTRWLDVPADPRGLSGHQGEWFSTAVGAYAALRRRAPTLSAHLAERIIGEVAREASAFLCFARERDGISLLKAATLIAHNLGDLDRVLDMWKVPEGDPLRQQAFKAGHAEGLGGDRTLVVAGSLNKMFMVDDNHRHFALRGPRCLRRRREFLLPVGPFFDEWGKTIATHPDLTPEEVAEVAHALIDGWEWFQKPRPNVPTPVPGAPFGYPRALRGILEHFAGGESRLLKYLPARQARRLQTGALRSSCSVTRARFEEQWNHRALKAFAEMR